MMKKVFLLIPMMLFICCMQVMAQYKVLITNLNNKEEYELKLNEEFYFGTINTNEVFKGKLDGIAISSKSISINNKAYPIGDITWIDFKGIKPKKNTSKISKILFYFGASLLGFSVYEYYEANDKQSAMIVGSAGAACTLGALAFWILPKQPRFNFATKHLLEIIQIAPEKIGTND